MLEVVEQIKFLELEQRLRQVQLLKSDAQGNPIYPYKDAHITFRQVHPDEVNPTTFYLLRQGIEQQRQLRQEFRIHHIDTLALGGAVVYRTEEGTRTLLPPIVEVQEEEVIFKNPLGDQTYVQPFRVKIPVINDGAHRVYVAREEKVSPVVCVISGALVGFPLYAFPNHWDDVKIVDAVPERKEEKKLYRRGDNYALYRNFDSVFVGCSKPRK